MTTSRETQNTDAGSNRMTLRRAAVASLLGTSLEWYDFFLYGFAATIVFSKLFFPSHDPLVGVILAFSTYAVGYFSRPLGGFVFGHVGDRLGRKRALVWTLLLMGGCTVLIGALPTYHQIGVAAPLLLVLLRFIQGVGIGGEWGGAVLLTLENGQQGNRGFAVSWTQVGVPAGNLLGTAALAVTAATLSDAAFMSWGWRLPFFLSAALIAVGFWVRARLPETPVYEKVKDTRQTARMPVKEVLRDHWRRLLVAGGARIGSDVAYGVFAVFVVTYAVQHVGMSKGAALTAVLLGSLGQLVIMPLCGHLSDRFGRRPVYAVGALATAVWGFAFFALADTASVPLLCLAVVVGLGCHAIMYGVQGAFVAEQFPARVRYSGTSVAYTLSGLVSGAIAPLVAALLLRQYGTGVAIAVYVAASALVTCVALALAVETRQEEIADVVAEGDAVRVAAVK